MPFSETDLVFFFAESEQIKATLSRGLHSDLRGEIGQFGK